MKNNFKFFLINGYLTVLYRKVMVCIGGRRLVTATKTGLN
jgi:hypothetical protein